ncbi:MAG: hypothetical protein MJ171_01370 [Clostridia bacterium]|nr:hypothetical protein [Clostridia bacterium]
MKKITYTVLCILLISALAGCKDTDDPATLPDLLYAEYNGMITGIDGKLVTIDTGESFILPDSMTKQLNLYDIVTASTEYISGTEKPYIINSVTVHNGNPDISSDFRKTETDFTYTSLQLGAAPSKGKVKVMFIPILWNDGVPFDKEFEDIIEKRFYDDSSIYTDSIHTYFMNASYNMLDLSYDIMAPYETCMSYSDWMTHVWSPSQNEIMTNAYKNALSAAGDISVYDSDGNGYADIVVFIENVESPSSASYAYTMTKNETALLSDSLLKMRKYAMCFYRNFIHVDDYRDNTVIHEMSHLFGIPDQYDYMGSESYISRFDLQEGGFGDWNAYSKYATGWINPYVITPDVEKVTLRIGDSAEYPDAILLPPDNWNGTPFDEYLIIDVFAGRKNNEKPWEFYVFPDSENYNGGVRIMHVDARQVYTDETFSKSKGWVDVENYDIDDSYLVQNAYSNSSTDIPDPSPERNAKYHFTELIPCSGDVTPDYMYNTAYLFSEGTRFSIYDYSHKFPNTYRLNHNGSVEYIVKIDSYDSTYAVATVTIEKITYERNN